MKLVLLRIYSNDSYCIGKLYINDIYFCDTLEDSVHQGTKIQDKTAIPYGLYNVLINYSVRFNCLMPLLENVPGFKGIRIHSGNTSADTSGCILVGKNNIKGKLTASRSFFIIVFQLINKAFRNNEMISIRITDKY